MRSVRVLMLLILASLLAVSAARSQNVPKPPKSPPPKLEAVAETQLIMEGMLQSNFRGLEKILRGVPKDGESWAFARGQSLLMAEAGNLLMLRPPKGDGQEAWMARAADLREACAKLARLDAAKDLVRARTALVEVADVCNRCHETFRVKTRITTFAEEGK